jgi:hypothetical protein
MKNLKTNPKPLILLLATIVFCLSSLYVTHIDKDVSGDQYEVSLAQLSTAQAGGEQGSGGSDNRLRNCVYVTSCGAPGFYFRIDCNLHLGSTCTPQVCAQCI